MSGNTGPFAELVAEDDSRARRRFLVRYALLTSALFFPLLISFAGIRNLYPFAASTMMMAGGDLRRERVYYVLRGETSKGELIDLPPISLTDGLSGRHWGLVGAAADNKSFKIRFPHPANTAKLEMIGGADELPRAALLPDLLRAWGEIYNDRLPADSVGRLRAVRLEVYVWGGKSYADYRRHLETWRAEL